MLTYQYELIFGASWVAQTGSVNADSPSEARAKIFEELVDIDDPCPDKWIETHDTPPRFRVDISKTYQGVDSERLEFWQVATLFSQTEVL